MKVYFERMPGAPIWFRHIEDEPPYYTDNYNIVGVLTFKQIEKLMRKLRKDFPKVRYELTLYSKIRSRILIYEFKICLGNAADQTFFILKTKEGIEI